MHYRLHIHNTYKYIYMWCFYGIYICAIAGINDIAAVKRDASKSVFCLFSLHDNNLILYTKHTYESSYTYTVLHIYVDEMAIVLPEEHFHLHLSEWAYVIFHFGLCASEMCWI